MTEGGGEAAAGVEPRRPSILRLLVIAIALLNTTGVLFLEDSRLAAPTGPLWVSAVMGVNYLALWRLWRGKNWARWFFLITWGVLAPINLIGIPEMDRVQQTVVIAEAVLGVYLLYGLNTRQAKAFFRQNLRTE